MRASGRRPGWPPKVSHAVPESMTISHDWHVRRVTAAPASTRCAAPVPAAAENCVEAAEMALVLQFMTISLAGWWNFNASMVPPGGLTVQ